MSWLRKKPVAGPRHIVLHYHIFKNAGSTIYSILERHFGRRLAALESGHFNSNLRNDTLLEYLQENRKIQAVSTHHLLPPKPQHPDFVFHDVLFLRNPLARLSSMYDFYRRSNVTDDALSLQAKQKTTGEFMRFLIDQHPHQVSNAQVNYLAALSRNVSESVLETAVRVAKQASVLGLAEMFDVGAVLAQQSLAPFFGKIDFGYVARNVSSMAPREIGTHLRQFREACGEETYQSLLSSNALDLTLLEIVSAEVQRRFEAMPDHEERLKHFITWRSIIMAFGLHPSAIRGALASNHPHDFVRYANWGAN